MDRQKVYKYGFFSMIGAFLLYLFSDGIKNAVDQGAKKAKGFFADAPDSPEYPNPPGK
jgi:hypothetical protein